MLDTIIIGAGAAGLRAAKALQEGGKRYLILEARDRIGGRVRDSGQLPAFALGAEFIHGSAEETRALLTALEEPSYRIEPQFRVFERGRIRKPGDFWEKLAHALGKVRPGRGDRAFDEALRAARLSPTEQKLASGFVQGFVAAEASKLSASAAHDLVGMAGNPEERAMGRALSGYGRMLEGLAKDAEAWTNIRLGSVVDRIEWKRGEARVHVLGASFRARSALVTAPIGVLRAPQEEEGAIRFEPPIRGLKSALEKIEMGHVVRLALEFETGAFAKWTERFDGDLPFVMSPELRYSTWWSFRPIRWPAVVAWAGGERALELAKIPAAERAAIAVAELARVLHVGKSEVMSALVQVHHHDWSADPFSRGAYSYPGVGGEDSVRKLSRSVESTIWFAGEALDAIHGGTVEGALRSGRKQGKRIVRALDRRVSRARSPGSRHARGAPGPRP